ncbi:MAG: NAD-dependent epimerase/dehydratase family protein [Nitriliruptorales bacterium]|nr:NAD-dependent epimerase/dehydratase family protein [Nitriliruptorales bacterium]
MAKRRQRVLITGIAGQLAGQLAARLEADDSIEYIAGLDLHEPSHDLTRTEFVRADLRNPLVARIIDSTRVDTVVHLSLTAVPSSAGGRSRMKELNVIGTMQLLAAAQKAPKLHKVVVKSTTAVYGSNYADPALFREDVAPGGAPRSGYSKDAVEVENYARAFGRRREDVVLTILRFANFIGPTVDSPLTGYLGLPVVPRVLGYDPRLQLCHQDDGVEVLYRSVTGSHPGIYNVAGPGIIYLSQAIRMAGKPTVPVALPFVQGLAGTLRRSGRVDFSPDQLQFLLYGRVGDISRLRRSYGYEPRFSTRAGFENFLASGRITPLVEQETVRGWERSLHQLLTRRPASKSKVTT